MDDDLTIPGPLRLVWRAADLMMGTIHLGSVGNVYGTPIWSAWIKMSNPREFSEITPVGRFPTETAARAALVVAVREAVTT